MIRKFKWVEADSPDEAAVRVARRALDARLSSVWEWLPLASDQPDEDLEYVHQLRVSSRRAMAAIDTFESLLPRRRTAWFRKQLNRVRRAAGNAREFDVLGV